MQIKRIALGGIISDRLQPMPVSEQVTELHHTEVWKIIFPRYNKMAQIQK